MSRSIDRIKTRVRPTIKTLAEHTGYSIATISKALHGSPVVTEETRKIILSAADELGYQANARGMALRTGKTYQAAVLMPMNSVAGYEWDGVEYTQILSGLSQILDDSDYQLSVYGYRSFDDACAITRRIVDQSLADGLIFSGVLADDARIDMLVEADFPFVSLGRCRKSLVYAHVDVDNEWAAHAATARLIAGGHRRIGLVNADARFPMLSTGSMVLRVPSRRQVLRHVPIWLSAATCPHASDAILRWLSGKSVIHRRRWSVSMNRQRSVCCPHCGRWGWKSGRTSTSSPMTTSMSAPISLRRSRPSISRSKCWGNGWGNFCCGVWEGKTLCN